MQLSDNVKGAIFMSCSMASFTLNDALIKTAGTDLGVLQSIFVRGTFATAMIFGFAWLFGAFQNLPNREDSWKIGFRTLAEIGATFCFLVALFNIPLANITAIIQSLPLTLTLAAALFLGEPFGWRRGLAIVAGLCGVLIIIRPGAEGFNHYALLGLGTVFFVTVRDLTVRKLSASVSSLFVAFVTAITITAVSGVALFLTGGWVPMPPGTTLLLAVAAVFVLSGYYFSIAAMRVGDVASVTPYRYTSILWAIGLGWVFFNEIPDFWTQVGIAIILVTGVFTMWRERRLQKRTQGLS
ncbi:MAG: DMT family transporter [Rhodobacteraceae bacterium]|nr:DMT family transporter [Paracoccaceae bacterium]